MAELPAAAAVLARAFCDNPGIVAMLGTRSPARRLALLQRLTPVLARVYREHGAAWVARARDGGIAGVALVAPPGVYPPRMPMAWQLTWGVVRNLPLPTAARLGVTDQILRHHHVRTRHHYLFMLGVDPARQGQGHGGALLRALNERAATTGLPCYLETDKLTSVRLYERHGYVVTRERKFSRQSDLTVWFMERPPALDHVAK